MGAPVAPSRAEGWAAGLTGGRVARALGAPVRRLRAALAPYAETSLVARHIETASTLGVGAVFLVSPFVGTGLNAAAVLAAAACVALRRLLVPGSAANARPGALDVVVVAYLLVHLVATAASPVPLSSLKGLAKMLVYWLAYWSFRETLGSPGARRWIVGCLLAAGFVESVYGVYQWFIGVEPLANWEDPEALNPLTRVYSTLMNPNLLAGYLLPIFPLAVSAAAGAFKARWARLLALATALLTPVCVWFTYSRGAFLGLLLELVVFGAVLAALNAARLKRQKWLPAALGGSVALGAAGLAAFVARSESLRDRIGSIFTLRGHSSNSFRVNVWTGVLHMVQDWWLFGVGVGNKAFRQIYSLYMVSGFEALGAYNIVLEALAEMGVLGLAVFVTLWAVTGKQAGTVIRTGTREARLWAASVLGGLAGTLTMGMVDTVYYRPAIQLQFWLLVALVATLAAARRPDGRDSAR